MFATLVRFIREWKRYNRSLNELSRLGDRELADIGISRSDIHARGLERRTAALSVRLNCLETARARRGRFRLRRCRRRARLVCRP